MSEKEGAGIRCRTRRGMIVTNPRLEQFGDELARREGYRSVGGMLAVELYLVRTYHWLPEQVRALTHEELEFVLSEEMFGWSPSGTPLL